VIDEDGVGCGDLAVGAAVDRQLGAAEFDVGVAAWNIAPSGLSMDGRELLGLRGAGAVAIGNADAVAAYLGFDFAEEQVIGAAAGRYGEDGKGESAGDQSARNPRGCAAHALDHKLLFYIK
jgi:hypothetical protein